MVKRPIRSLMDKMIESHGTTVIRIAFSSKLKCENHKTNDKTSGSRCKKCLGSGHLAAAKTERVIIDTIMERNFESETDLGTAQNVSVKIYSKIKLNEGEYIIDTLNKEMFKVGSVFKERFTNGEVDAYISGAVKVSELLYLIDTKIINKISDRWCKLW